MTDRPTDDRRMMQSIWPSTPGEATHALEDDPDPTDDDDLPICARCGKPQTYLHDIGTEIRCGEVTVMGEYTGSGDPVKGWPDRPTNDLLVALERTHGSYIKRMSDGQNSIIVRTKEEELAECYRLMGEALGRIYKLERWKAEAITVITEWELVWDALDRPGPLGSSKAAASLAEVERLRSHPPDQVDDQ